MSERVSEALWSTPRPAPAPAAVQGRRRALEQAWGCPAWCCLGPAASSEPSMWGRKASQLSSLLQSTVTQPEFPVTSEFSGAPGDLACPSLSLPRDITSFLVGPHSCLEPWLCISYLLTRPRGLRGQRAGLLTKHAMLILESYCHVKTLVL